MSQGFYAKDSPATKDWHIVSRHFAASVGSYSDNQIGAFFDIVNGKKLDAGSTKCFIGGGDSVGTGVFMELGVSNSSEGSRWWQRWQDKPSNLFCLTDRLSEYLQDKNVARYIKNRLDAYETHDNKLRQCRLKLDLSEFETQIPETPGLVPQFSDIFKAELVKQTAEVDMAHEYRVIGTVIAVFRNHPLLQPEARLTH